MECGLTWIDEMTKGSVVGRSWRRGRRSISLEGLDPPWLSTLLPLQAAGGELFSGEEEGLAVAGEAGPRRRARVCSPAAGSFSFRAECGEEVPGE
jgi:hypothetical protein